MKLIVQIPCLNEENFVGGVIRDIPRSIPGIDQVLVFVIDDGSRDGTRSAAVEAGADKVIRNKRNLGLARSFRKGIDAALGAGADIIVNIDGDHQYRPEDIPRLIQPILSGEADVVIGDRRPGEITHFSPVKRWLQWFGSRVVSGLAKAKANDVTSGFRALSREAASKITILSGYTYTIESVLQAEHRGLTIREIEVETNPPNRPSRLMSSMWSYLAFSTSTIIRIFTMYNPLSVFLGLGAVLVLFGSALGLRFVYFFILTGGEEGKIQSLILVSILIIGGLSVALVGLVADLIQFNRRLLEELVERVRKLEFDAVIQKKNTPE